MDKVVPRRERVGQFGGGVAQQSFPNRREMHRTGREIQFEEAERAVFCQETKTPDGFSLPIRTVCGDIRRGLNGCDVPRGTARLLFEPHTNFAKRAFTRLGGERSFATESAEQHLPLRLNELGIGRNHFEREKQRKRFADQLGFGYLPELRCGGVRGSHPTFAVQNENGTEVRAQLVGPGRIGGKSGR